MTKKQVKLLFATMLATCNPKSRQFYNSLMLENGGKLIIKVPKDLCQNTNINGKE